MTVEILKNTPSIIYAVVLFIVALTGAVLGIFRIITYLRDRTERMARLNRDIQIKETEMDAMRQRHHQEHEDLEANYEGEIRIREFSRADFRTDNDRQQEARLFERQRTEERRMFAELGHLYELRDGKSVLLQRQSRFKKFLIRFFQRVRGVSK